MDALADDVEFGAGDLLVDAVAEDVGAAGVATFEGAEVGDTVGQVACGDTHQGGFKLGREVKLVVLEHLGLYLPPELFGVEQDAVAVEDGTGWSPVAGLVECEHASIFSCSGAGALLKDWGGLLDLSGWCGFGLLLYRRNSYESL